MNCLKTILLLFILLGINDNLLSQEYIINTKTLTTNDGLANLYTTSIFHDEGGFVWISTRYGLNRYDGYNFKLYSKEQHNLYSNIEIYQITKGENNTLWLFYNIDSLGNYTRNTFTNIDVFDPNLEKAIPIEKYFSYSLPFKVKDVLQLTIKDSKKRQWIATKNGEIFLLKNKQFEKILEIDGNISVITIDKKDNIYVGLDKKILVFNKSRKRIETKILSNFVEAIWVEDNGDLWIKTIKNNQNNQTVELLLSPVNQTIKSFKRFERDTVLFYQKRFDFYRINNDLWLINEPQNRYILNRKKEFIYKIKISENNKNTKYVITGNNTTIWFLMSSGLEELNIKPNYFIPVFNPKRIIDCRAISGDEKGNIYISCEHCYQYQRKSTSIERINDLKVSYFLSFFQNHLLSSSGNETSLFNNFINRFYLKTPFINRPVTSLLASDDKNKFFLGTKKGLLCGSMRSDTLTAFSRYNEFIALKDYVINAMIRKGQNIWLATSHGIFLMTEKDGIIKQYSLETGDLPFNHIRHFYIDKSNVFWLASKGGGLIKWQPFLEHKTTSSYQQFTVNNGLSNNYLYAIYEDSFNNLWITSDNGLMLFDKETEQVRTFTTEDGLLHNEFNFLSHYQTKDGQLYFGGLGGVIAFHPKDFINQKSNKSTLVITEVLVIEEDKEVALNKTNQFFQQKYINLYPKDKLLEFKFSLLDFKGKDNHIYTYRIKGYRDQWTYSKEHFVRITNLPYGSYILEIKGKSNDDNWSENVILIPIYVLKPFYLQWWFMGLTLVSLVLVILLIIRYRIEQLEKDKIRLSQEVEKRTFQIQQDKQIIEQQAESLKALDVAKSKFFSNITHEFRTPLTLILGPIHAVLKEKVSKKTVSQLTIAYNNAQQLLKLVNQLLDISKLEDDKIKIGLTRGDIIFYTQQIIQQLESLSKEKRQIIEFKHTLNKWEIDFDQEKWNNIIMNLVSNAIKFTPAKGLITISINQKKIDNYSNILLKVTDTGIGIPASDIEHIFDRFYQVDSSSTRMQQGTGIGLSLVKELIKLQNGTITVESESQKGTVFTVLLPIQGNTTTLQISDVNEVDIYQSPTNNIENITSIFTEQDKLTILIVEDNEDMRTYIKSCLDRTIFEIIEASNGDEGIEKAIAYVPDLIISDVMMPIKDGFEVADIIRQNMITAHIPIIILTAKRALESKLKGIRKGVDAYLTKPFNTDELILRIYKLIELRKNLQLYYTNQQVQKSDVEVVETKDMFIQQFKVYILDNLDGDNLEVEQLAKVFGISRMQLHRKIKALTNMNTSTYIRNLRLEVALKLLKQKKLTVTEIAYCTGFSSQSHFSRVFKKKYKKSPSEI